MIMSSSLEIVDRYSLMVKAFKYGMTMEEIAQMVGIPVTVVQSAVRNALPGSEVKGKS